MGYQERIGKAVVSRPELFPAGDVTEPVVKHKDSCSYERGACNCEPEIEFETKGRKYFVDEAGAVHEFAKP